jgi:hypothetical protein
MRSVRIGALSPLLRSFAEETLLQMEAEYARSLVCAFNCCVRALHVSPVFLSLVCVLFFFLLWMVKKAIFYLTPVQHSLLYVCLTNIDVLTLKQADAHN